MGKLILKTKLSDTLTLSEQTDGFWLWDDTRRMNLSMQATTPTDAFVEALSYYQKRLKTVETALVALSSKVNTFVSLFVEEDED